MEELVAYQNRFLLTLLELKCTNIVDWFIELN